MIERTVNMDTMDQCSGTTTPSTDEIATVCNPPVDARLSSFSPRSRRRYRPALMVHLQDSSLRLSHHNLLEGHHMCLDMCTRNSRM